MRSGLSVKLHWRNIFPGPRRFKKNVNEKSHRIWIVSHTRWDFNIHRLFTAYDRIEVERFFSLDKHCYGAGLIMTKLPETTLSSIAMSVLVGNLFRIPTGSLFLLYFVDSGTESESQHYMEFVD